MGKKYLLLFSLLLCAWSVRAHSPHITTYNFRQLGGVWVLEASFAQSGLNQAVMTREGKDSEALKDELAFKQAVARMLREGTSIQANGRPVMLEEMGVRLGSHQSDIKCALAGLPDSIHTMKVNLQPLPGIEGHQNVFRMTFGGAHESVVLDEDNAYTASVTLRDGQIMIDEKEIAPPAPAYLYAGIALAACLILGVVVMLLRMRKSA